ncbi:acetyl-CoA carboxylase biotin carboxylase subunit [Parabacteroides sp. PF5-5]|uniref:acetyl-CoA carboxylase biotin carboxylase subunit n=1 Tax=unclassified Parabacteroides TaxID=2649774 RepID=UPI002476A578|nr:MULTISPECIES: acetyl-CoA carboxylase biotin carboxylase subunit [unclassified Parabacteroides]MDH6304096.1 acetyl-CoA carboxylase biotin carboxylase subunit [Parabacteroides sp. PH5-39]MDH6315204.1 acetyl-CoA carboxylase biotin carboxylase subunit [Parabacteroides sp. PF5-13]MDH6318849.1 acetyl-CoA carboxylase biotin carboxylase subunit [Parabacteroides sp. PH5-13]MDH6322578.1 acetyl-CoA carboxylase biotin carboxylase subunit [Parabacteroides sp. PH5-8]MDH6326270.1 acetyl-CoA carboxylase bi
MIKKVLVANRGEIAMRIFRTCRVMKIPTVAIYTHVDRGALHVRYAEEAYCISENEEDTSYLKPDLILEIAKKTGAAIHPGYGFLSENADFARRCEEEGINFIGPSADVIAKMGLKTEARKIMKAAGVPVVPGTEDPVTDLEEVRTLANEIGYPIMLKAAAGGGGKGMRLVREEKDLDAAFRMSRSEAANSFGNDSVYIEKYIENPHHIEVQVLGDKYGNVIHLYERECSIQRRNQKVIEESPSPFVKEETRRKMLAISVEACKKIGYYSAGTLEFMMDKDQNFYFLEMNTRLQVEHPVTEECTGVDLVRDMILVASGSRLPYKQEDIEFRGAAIECRIYAEDPANNFMPSPGIIRVREAPEGRNVRLDSAAYAGFEVSLHYDPMIAKLCSWGRNRESAISNMVRALREYKILGIKTTIPFHLSVLHNKTFLKGNYDTTFIDTKFDKEELNRRQNSDPTVAVIAAAIKHFEGEKEAAARATTVPLVGESLWKHYGKLQMSANNF